MRRRGSRLAAVFVMAGALSMLGARPVLADHDHDDHWHHARHHEHHEHEHGWYGSRSYYYGGYAHRYYEPRVQYYSEPVYVPPPPSSFGLNLVFPIH